MRWGFWLYFVKITLFYIKGWNFFGKVVFLYIVLRVYIFDKIDNRSFINFYFFFLEKFLLVRYDCMKKYCLDEVLIK